MYCSNCGKEIVNDSKVCSNCGNMVSPIKERGIINIDIENVDIFINKIYINKRTKFALRYKDTITCEVPFGRYEIIAVYGFDIAKMEVEVNPECSCIYLKAYNQRSIAKLKTNNDQIQSLYTNTKILDYTKVCHNYKNNSLSYNVILDLILMGFLSLFILGGYFERIVTTVFYNYWLSNIIFFYAHIKYYGKNEAKV